MGRKTKKGIFDYSNKKGPRPVTPQFTKIAQEMSMSNAHGLNSDDDLVDRILLRYTNEAALCLQEEVIMSPQEVRLVDNYFSKQIMNWLLWFIV